MPAVSTPRPATPVTQQQPQSYHTVPGGAGRAASGGREGSAETWLLCHEEIVEAKSANRPVLTRTPLKYKSNKGISLAANSTTTNGGSGYHGGGGGGANHSASSVGSFGTTHQLNTTSSSSSAGGGCGGGGAGGGCANAYTRTDSSLSFASTYSSPRGGWTSSKTDTNKAQQGQQPSYRSPSSCSSAAAVPASPLVADGKENANSDVSSLRLSKTFGRNNSTLQSNGTRTMKDGTATATGSSALHSARLSKRIGAAGKQQQPQQYSNTNTFSRGNSFARLHSRTRSSGGSAASGSKSSSAAPSPSSAKQKKAPSRGSAQQSVSPESKQRLQGSSENQTAPASTTMTVTHHGSYSSLTSAASPFARPLTYSESPKASLPTPTRSERARQLREGTSHCSSSSLRHSGPQRTSSSVATASDRERSAEEIESLRQFEEDEAGAMFSPNPVLGNASFDADPTSPSELKQTAAYVQQQQEEGKLQLDSSPCSPVFRQETETDEAEPRDSLVVELPPALLASRTATPTPTPRLMTHQEILAELDAEEKDEKAVVLQSRQQPPADGKKRQLPPHLAVSPNTLQRASVSVLSLQTSTKHAEVPSSSSSSLLPQAPTAAETVATIPTPPTSMRDCSVQTEPVLILPIDADAFNYGRAGDAHRSSSEVASANEPLGSKQHTTGPTTEHGAESTGQTREISPDPFADHHHDNRSLDRKQKKADAGCCVVM